MKEVGSETRYGGSEQSTGWRCPERTKGEKTKGNLLSIKLKVKMRFHENSLVSFHAPPAIA